MSADDWLQQLAVIRRARANRVTGVPVGHPGQWRPEMREECERLKAAQASFEDYSGLL